MDDGRLGDEMTLTALAQQLAEFRVEMRSGLKALDAKLDEKVGGLDGKVDGLDGKINRLAEQMKMEFEETRRVINLGFENTQMLDEKIDRRFDETDRAHRDQRTLLEAAVKDLHRTSSANSL